jgi:hypothetical protein
MTCRNILLSLIAFRYGGEKFCCNAKSIKATSCSLLSWGVQW